MGIRIGRVAVVGLIAALLSFVVVPVASADLVGQIFLDPVGSTLTTSCGGLCPGPMATVTIHLVDSDTATVTFHALLTGGVQYFFGGAGPTGNIVGLVLSDTNFTGTNLLWSNSYSGFFNPTLSFALGGTVDGVGVYNQSIDTDTNGYKASLTDISFQLDWSDSPGFVSAADVIDATQNLQSWVDSITGLTVTRTSWVEAHLSACVTPATTGCNFPSSSAVATAWAGGAVVGVPEPGTLALLGSGLLLLGTVARRRFIR